MSGLALTSLECIRIARRTAEMLALPEMVCSKRLCRRTHVCEFFDKANGERWCLRRLSTEQRAAWDELYATAIRIADAVFLSRPASDPRIRELEEAAIEIVRAVPLHDPRCHYVKRWLAAYRAAAPEDAKREPDMRESDGVETIDDIAFADAADPRLDWRTYR